MKIAEEYLAGILVAVFIAVMIWGGSRVLRWLYGKEGVEELEERNKKTLLSLLAGLATFFFLAGCLGLLSSIGIAIAMLFNSTESSSMSIMDMVMMLILFLCSVLPLVVWKLVRSRKKK